VRPPTTLLLGASRSRITTTPPTIYICGGFFSLFPIRLLGYFPSMPLISYILGGVFTSRNYNTVGLGTRDIRILLGKNFSILIF
ncbi:hypothetical protein BDV12DRAFT_177541, partial [Aspergillus spectabilis]